MLIIPFLAPYLQQQQKKLVLRTRYFFISLEFISYLLSFVRTNLQPILEERQQSKKKRKIILMSSGNQYDDPVRA